MERATLEAMLAGCPYHRGLQLALDDFSASEGWITVSLAVRAELSRSEERTELHGGAIAALIDIAGDLAVALKVGAGVPTIGLSVDYLRPARGSRVAATARLLRCGRTIAVVDVSVQDETGVLVAVGRGTYASRAPQ
jgi:uncharacterized protein (TIGR00369 family)